MLLTLKGALISSAVFFAMATHAEPAVFSNGTMTIPEGAVVTPEGNAYYTNITLKQDANRALVITSATPNSLVTVETVDILVMESFPLQVSASVSGYLSIPCVKLLNPAVSYQDGVFQVVLAESNPGPAEICIAVTEPFTTSIALDVEGLPAGIYQVDVNGVSAEFSFDTDNSILR